MVASLQSKKEALEAKLKDKTNELKKLCFEEAELTGILPAETPLEPGETPPHIPRRIGTSFTFPENLIDKLQSREDKAIASLELECQIQTGIAEAALGIANDGSSSRSVRRRHKVIYQESQRKLFDLEAKLNSLKHSQGRQLKKNNSTTSEGEQDFGDVDEKSLNVNRNIHANKHETLSHSLSDSWVPPHNFHSFNSLSRVTQYYPVGSGHHCSSRYNLGVNYMNSALPNIRQHYMTMPNQSHADPNLYMDNERNSIMNTHLYNNDTYEANLNRNRSGFIERSDQYPSYNENFSRMASTLPRNGGVPPANSVLLPGQTYPDNSLMRTQSLGNVGHYNQPEKKKEKEWYETSLDSSPVPPRSHTAMGHVSPTETIKTPEPTYEKMSDQKYAGSPVKTQHAVINNYQFDTVVPYESPKNHTVIEAGKWQPYREVTKPFEMSDFYKYSTKYRKGKSSPGSASPRNDLAVQQKAIYQPLQPQECQPLSNEVNKNALSPLDLPKSLPSTPEPVNAWYDEKQPTNSATLV